MKTIQEIFHENLHLYFVTPFFIKWVFFLQLWYLYFSFILLLYSITCLESQVKMKVSQSCPTLCNSMDSPRNSSGQNTGVGTFSMGSSHPGIEPRWPTLQADSLPAEPQGKPKNTGVGSPSLFQQIFLTQEQSWGLQHCRQILYQLNYQGSLYNPKLIFYYVKNVVL